MNDAIVTLTSFSNAMEANIAAEKLRVEGIPCFLTDETTISLAWHLTTALGGIRLRVFEKDVVAAREIINLPTDNSVDHYDEQESSIACPKCNSRNVTKSAAMNGTYSGFHFMLSLVFGFPVPFKKIRFHCFECGNEFKVVKDHTITRSSGNQSIL